jgi:hypothetical protein
MTGAAGTSPASDGGVNQVSRLIPHPGKAVAHGRNYLGGG